MLVPLALFFSHGGWPTAIAAFVMVCFHLGILTSIPMGVPLEWNVFMIFCVLSLFVGHAADRAGRPDHAVADRAVRRCVAGTVVARKPVPAQGVLPARHALLRGQLGHLAVVRQAVGGGEDRQRIWWRSPACRSRSWRSVYGSKEAAQIPLYLGYAFRAFNTHGRALFTLAHRAMAGEQRGRLRR